MVQRKLDLICPKCKSFYLAVALSEYSQQMMEIGIKVSSSVKDCFPFLEEGH
ncbi:MAG: hypothetical protein PWQ63_713 [Methanolobus sp.]|nr:hypothetical protein [Methanolobus sp.]